MPELPTVSLLISMRNEAGYIRGCLESVFGQDYAGALDVWIMDGQSDDGSCELVQELITGRSNGHLLSNPKITQAAGWNLGIRESHGRLVGIVSAHAVLAPDYVSVAVKTLLRTNADLVGGPMRAQGEGLVSRAIALGTSHQFGVGGARFHYTDREETVDTVYMGLGKRQVLVGSGGFDEEMVHNQDDELSYRLLERGAKIVCNPLIVSRYYGRSSLGGLWRQYFQYGYWKVRVMQKHPRQTRLRHLAPGALVLALLVTWFTGLYHPVGYLALGMIGGVYLCVNLFASWSIASRSRKRYLPILPIVFIILHVGYGLGFLLGIFAFRSGWAELVRGY